MTEGGGDTVAEKRARGGTGGGGGEAEEEEEEEVDRHKDAKGRTRVRNICYTRKTVNRKLCMMVGFFFSRVTAD